MNQRLTRRVQMIVVGSVALFFVLVVVLSFQIAIRVNHRNQETALAAQRYNLEQQIQGAERDLDFFQTDRFIEEFALSQGWARPGQGVHRR